MVLSTKARRLERLVFSMRYTKAGANLWHVCPDLFRECQHAYMDIVLIIESSDRNREIYLGNKPNLEDHYRGKLAAPLTTRYGTHLSSLRPASICNPSPWLCQINKCWIRVLTGMKKASGNIDTNWNLNYCSVWTQRATKIKWDDIYMCQNS